jgi:hypothetical protein
MPFYIGDLRDPLDPPCDRQGKRKKSIACLDPGIALLT